MLLSINRFLINVIADYLSVQVITLMHLLRLFSAAFIDCDRKSFARSNEKLQKKRPPRTKPIPINRDPLSHTYLPCKPQRSARNVPSRRVWFCRDGHPQRHLSLCSPPPMHRAPCPFICFRCSANSRGHY